MNCRKEGIKGTTAGILATLATIGTGVGITFWQASEFAAKCKMSSSFVSLIAAQNISLPSLATVVYNGIPMNISFIADPIPLASILGEIGVKAITDLPETLSELCQNEILMHGAAFTAIVASGLLFFTYNYRKNQTTAAEIKQIKSESEEKQVSTVEFSYP